MVYLVYFGALVLCALFCFSFPEVFLGFCLFFPLLLFPQTGEFVSCSPDPSCTAVQGKMCEASLARDQSGIENGVWFIHVGHQSLQSHLQKPFSAPRTAKLGAPGFFWAACLNVVSSQVVIIQSLKLAPGC